MQESEASWQASAALRRIHAILLASVVEEKLRRLERAVKANFNRDQPRVPRGNPDGGEWTGTGGGGATASDRDDGTNSNKRPSMVQLVSFDGEPPTIPKERPPRSGSRTRIYKQVAKWLARETVGKRLGLLLTVLDQAGWLEPAAHAIRTFSDPPKTLADLQSDVSNPAPGYDIHHIVEQTPAEQDGFPRSTIDAPDNLVRIPTLKHWEITGWYMIPNEEFGWSSPRRFLRGTDWDERVRVGQKALVKFGVVTQ